MALEGRNVDIQVAEDELVVWMTEEVQLECLMMMMQLLLHIWILRSVDDYYYSWKWELALRMLLSIPFFSSRSCNHK